MESPAAPEKIYIYINGMRYERMYTLLSTLTPVLSLWFPGRPFRQTLIPCNHS